MRRAQCRGSEGERGLTPQGLEQSEEVGEWARGGLKGGRGQIIQNPVDHDLGESPGKRQGCLPWYLKAQLPLSFRV